MEGEDTHKGDRSRLKPVILFILITGVLGIFILLQGKNMFFNTPKPSRVKIGIPAPNFTLPELDGNTVSLTDYRGKVVLLNIWATWCPPCVEEMPSMESLYTSLRGKDFEILAVSIDTTGAKAVAPFMRKHQLSFPVLVDPKGTIKFLYGTTGVPESFIIDKKGIINQIIIGPKNWAAPEVVRFFRNLIQKP
jgi:peroxiredoxin